VGGAGRAAGAVDRVPVGGMTMGVVATLDISGAGGGVTLARSSAEHTIALYEVNALDAGST
jgi:hypothetical protein